tara:strand:+ start:71 stop:811 length:741 start_codon:yes stop_codon:yes gene_type:complete
MYSIRTNGDTIAQEFAKLLGNSQNIIKVANTEMTVGQIAEEYGKSKGYSGEQILEWNLPEGTSPDSKVKDVWDTMSGDFQKIVEQVCPQCMPEGGIKVPEPTEFEKMLDEQLSGGGAENEADDNLSDFSDAALSDLLVEPEAAASDGSVDSVDDAINAFSSNADPAGHYIMNGLGKIAGSLRNKGEGFAADVVEATALSIRGDLVKEANRKSGIVSALNKMASNFSSNGDSFAADMVKVTINKISR